MISGLGGRIHYGWIVLGASIILMAVSSGVRFAFGVFIDPLVETYGWSRGDISLAYALQFIVGIAAFPVFGWLADRHGSRLVLIVSSLATAAGLLLTGTITELWHFYLFYGVLTGVFGSAAILLLPVTLTLWFEAKRGLASGLAWMSSALGPFVFSPVFSLLIWERGWGEAFMYTGAFGGAAMILAAVLIRNRPEDIREKAYGATASYVTSRPSASTVSMREIRHTGTYTHLVNIHFLGCVGHSILLAHSASMAIHMGMPPVSAALIITVYSGFSAITRFFVPLLAERFGGRTAFTLALVFQSTGALSLLWAKDIWSFYVFAVLFGIGYGGEMVIFPTVNRHYYGEDAPLNTLHSHQLAGGSIGMALGGWIGGAVFDFTGTYMWAVVASATAGYLGLASVVRLPRRKSKVAYTV